VKTTKLKPLFITFLVILTFLSCKEKVEKTKPFLTQLTESVYTSVTIQPDDLYSVYASVSGILDKQFIEEGDIVKKGEKLFQIINDAPEINSENAKLALELAKENYKGRADILRSIEDEIRAAKLKLSNDSINYFRQKNLWEKKVGSRVELDTRKLNYDVSKNNLEALQNKLARTEVELKNQIKRAENNYRATLVNTKDFSVKSKINGKVYALFQEPGELVSPQQPLASIGSATDFIIELLIDEVDIARVKLGQKVLVNLDAYGKEIFEAKVTKIYPRKEQRTQTFKVEALFEKAPETLYPGLSGEGNIVISKRDNALIIPYEYLLEGEKVLTENGEKEVKTGLKTLENVEIISGIDTSTVILKPN
jgi:multidrug resistance efflux pump